MSGLRSLSKIAIKYPKAINAPGANTNISEPNSSGTRVSPKSLPVPNNSRIAPSKVKAN